MIQRTVFGWKPRRCNRARGGSAIHKQIVNHKMDYKPAMIVIETSERRLYLVLDDGKAIKYGVSGGRDGFTWTGTHRITRKAEWPGWTPPAQMRQRVPNLPAYMPGGPDNPLGARSTAWTECRIGLL